MGMGHREGSPLFLYQSPPSQPGSSSLAEPPKSIPPVSRVPLLSHAQLSVAEDAFSKESERGTPSRAPLVPLPHSALSIHPSFPSSWMKDFLALVSAKTGIAWRGDDGICTNLCAVSLALSPPYVYPTSLSLCCELLLSECFLDTSSLDE